MKLRHKEFANEYVRNGGFLGKAYQVLHPEASRKTAGKRGAEYMKRADVRKYIAEKIKQKMKKFNITEDRILNELACIAFLDVSKLFDDKGNLKRLDEIEEHTRRAIASLEIEELFDNPGDARERAGFVKKLKTWDKLKALELLGKYKKMFTERIEHTADKSFADMILEGRKRSITINMSNMLQ